MKFQLIEQKKEIRGFKHFKNTLIIGDINGNLYLNQHLLAKDVDTSTHSLNILNNLLFFNVQDTKSFYDFANSKLTELGNIYPYFNFRNEKELLCTYNSRIENGKFIWDTVLYDLEKKLVIKYLPELTNVSIAEKLNKDYLIVYKHDYGLVNFSLLTSDYEWETDLGKYGEIRKILGIHEGLLWVSMYRGGETKDIKRLLAMDIDNGEVYLQPSTELPISDCFVEYLSEKRSILSIFGKIASYPSDSLLVELDAQTGAVLRNQRIESLFQENLKIGHWKYFEDKIFFTANTDMLTSTHIGVLDYKTLDLLWCCEVPNRKGFLKDLQVTEDKIYVLDQGGTLHIFEREE